MRLLERLWQVVTFPLSNWLNGPRLLQLEIRRPRLYKAIQWAVIALLAAFMIASCFLLWRLTRA